MGTSITFTTPVGRLVQGSTTKPREKDAENRPLTIKTGPNAGKPTVQYYLAIAIPKSPGVTHWGSEPWGQQIWNLGHQCFPGVAQRPDFAWKITDGDSQIPNKRGKKPCDTEGFKGHWIIRCGSTFAPQCYNANGTAAVPPESIKCGYFVQLSINCAGNESQQQPGLYMNCSMVALAAYGEEIQQGADPASAGFGQGVALPPGASTVPPAAFTPAQPGAPSAPVATPPAGPVSVPPPIGTVPPANPSSPPNPAFNTVPGTPAAPLPNTGVAPGAPAPTAPTPGNAPTSPSNAPPPPAAPAHVMLPASNGVPYADYVAKGWTDAMLRQHGFMQ